jgi:hypothetical protein
VNAPGFLSALGGDHAFGPELLPNISVISLAVEFAVRQHQADARFLGSGFDHLGRFAQSFQGPRRAICDNRNCSSRSATITHFSQCRHSRGFCPW